jgi:predicted Zn-dependent peptidase
VTEPRIHIVDRPEAPQSELRVGRVAAARSTPDYFALTVMNTILGGAFTSRLNTKLREEKGHTYGAGSGFSMRRAPGPFVAQAAVHTPVTHEALADVLHEIGRMGEEHVEPAELERAKRYVALRLPQRFESVTDITARLSEIALYDLPDDYFASYVDRIMAVTAEDVRSAAERHLDPGRMVAVVAGDRQAIEEPLRALGIGAVEILPSLPWAVHTERTKEKKC